VRKIDVWQLWFIILDCDVNNTKHLFYLIKVIVRVSRSKSVVVFTALSDICMFLLLFWLNSRICFRFHVGLQVS